MDKTKKIYEEMRQKARESAPTRWSRRELAQIALFKDAHQESIAPILSECQVRVLASGEQLLRAGEPCMATFLVLSGRLAIGTPPTTTYVRAGDSLGELFLRQTVVTTAPISAAEATRLLVIDRNSAWTLIRKSHEIARNWLSLFAERARVERADAGRAEPKTSPLPHAAHDARTGLFNRSWLDSILPRQIARSISGNQPLGLLLIEIDGFADYAARFGEDMANLAYQAVGHTVILNVRPTDLVVSYGAAQFAVMLPESDVAGACLAGERMRSAISRAGALAPEENVLHSLTISVGATELKSVTDAAALLAGAEAALELARAKGGDRVAMH